MARNPRHDVLFEPIQIGPKTMRNRFYQVPHCAGFGAAKPGSQARHRAIKAEGGWAAVNTEYAPMSAETDEIPYASASCWTDEDAQILSLMVNEVHEYGSLAGIELHHGGAHADRRDSRWPAAAPSQIASDMLTPFVVPEAPKTMDESDIERVKSDWVGAAARARNVGFDIIYVYGGHSYLLAQFLSPYYNKRTDSYGGSLENRARLWLETLEVVRAEVGADCAVAVRIALNAMGPAGVPIEETLEFIRMADDMVDLWDVNVGSLAEWQRDSAASRFYPEGYQLEWTGRAREATKKPIVGVARLTNPDRMVEIVRGGTWDIIGAARPSIADPFLPSKVEEGRLDEIRECMGINQCISRSVWGNHLGCVQNATAGEEYRRGWHPERYTPAANADKGVLIVGAGPAGMECAMVLGKRSMARVHLVDANAEIGGIMRWIPRLPTLGEWARFVNYRQIQLDKLRNVEVIANTTLDAAAIRDYGAEIVIVATGASWAGNGISGVTHDVLPGADPRLPYVLTPEQVMLEGKRPPGKKAVVYDCEGYFMAAGIAELLRDEGYEVTVLSALVDVAPFCNETLEGPILRQRLHDAGIGMRPKVAVTLIEEGRLIGETLYGDPVEVPMDAVVLTTQRLSNDALYRELKRDPDGLDASGIEGLYRIGDCVAPRMLADTVFDGHRLAREIDTVDPATPLDWVRERSLPSTLGALAPAALSGVA
jgi:dimethylamine/trimethylamine dehydrogenase